MESWRAFKVKKNAKNRKVDGPSPSSDKIKLFVTTNTVHLGYNELGYNELRL